MSPQFSNSQVEQHFSSHLFFLSGVLFPLVGSPCSTHFSPPTTGVKVNNQEQGPSMAEYNRSRSYSYSDDRKQMDIYKGSYGPRSVSAYPNDLRSYSASYTSTYGEPPPQLPPLPGQLKDWKLKKGKSTSGSTSKSWSVNDPEFQRKKRVAGYKVYSVEGKVKGSFSRSFRWLKDKYTQVVYGWW